MQPNLLILMSDQHVPFACGAYGSTVVRTPNLDRLAARGTVFDAAYCNSPICVPSRAAMATGRYVHQTGNADNASPYLGAEADSWGHRTTAAGIPTTTIGKLHYRSTHDDTGFPDQRRPLHVREGKGDLFHALRELQPPAFQLRAAVLAASEGESDYSRFDRSAAQEAVRWLEERSSVGGPWVGKVSFVTPHYPFTVPKEFLDLYPLEELAMPRRSDEREWDRHPAMEVYRRGCGLDEPLGNEETLRAVQAYYGLVSFMDAQAGIVLGALEATGQAENTIILYVSDHGELLGIDGLWFKGTMSESSVRIPAILAGPGVPVGRCATPVSLVDVFPTVLDAMDVPAHPDDADLPGRSLLEIAGSPEDLSRTVFSEYHSANSNTGSFMIRRGPWKYIYHAGLGERLFNLDADPWEGNDLVLDPTHSSVLDECRSALREICNPDLVDARIRAGQRQRIEDYGGVDAVLARPLMAYSPASTS
ncbi:sulfatase-like hydrolase/transferase [Arthrobacter sp. ISL-85]|uniref:sulfatase-like hydrolase/transferase n=1 Tax=Arthrobacter sp. ISL-85 TaxID=2819115 RepID=UPI001BE56557|nr:sulfatase-like hydrolase/transferase [Arthrobacter sp. ISL-85]MBT2568170.1 sulfatase-like hydrolase/transferase [Arthrobacter sp. ISL-85]